MFTLSRPFLKYARLPALLFSRSTELCRQVRSEATGMLGVSASSVLTSVYCSTVSLSCHLCSRDRMGRGRLYTVVGLGHCAVCTLNVVCSSGFAARIKALQVLNLLSDTRCVLFDRALVNTENMNIVPA